MKKIKLTAAWTTILMAGIAQMAFAPQAKAGWDWYGDFVQPNAEAIRANTVGRLFDQTFVGSLDGQTLENLKAQYGGDYQAVVTDWCSNAAASSYPNFPYDIPYIGSTWRAENGGINCYVRNFNF
jgi:hypothetical protein